MSSQRTLLALFITLLAIGCDNAVSVGPTVAFSRPEYLAFTCFAPRVDDPEQFDLLPQACCSRTDPFANSSVCPKLGEQRLARLHALVTQSTRGELAAVDMSLPSDQRVLDSDSLIPGYTFLDSGGLPTAVVVPPHQQRPANVNVGPRFTFVASAEEYQIRAIPTCRFRSGSACGPELATSDAAVGHLRLPLPAAPGDMILGPDAALWVTLPELALIARIELADALQFPADAFARDPATRGPRAPQFFRVPEPGSAEPPPPIAEAEVYAEVCGTSSRYVPQRVGLPIAPRAPTPPIRSLPLRMRFERSPDAPDGVLLVSDAAAPVLHAFTLGADGSLTPRGALPTGAPLRAFAITGPVPVELPRAEPGGVPGTTPEAAAALPTRRYLYAIDDRDGSVMVFQYALESGTPSLIPLLAPVPGERFADRIGVPAPAATLDVIDNRDIAPTACRPNPPAGFDTNASPTYLRGVSVAVASQSGIVSIIDVHDLDAACRAQRQCNYAGGDPTRLNAGTAAGVAIRRHAARRSFAVGITGGVSVPTALKAAEPCEDPSMTPVDGTGGRVCAPTDPWYQRADAWSIQYRAALPGTFGTGAALSAGDLSAAKLVLNAPGGFDLCGRGVLPGDVVSVGYPTERGDNACAALGGDEPDNLLRIVEARRDQLVLQPMLGEQAPANETEEARDERLRRRSDRATQLTRCFPDLVRFEVRTRDFLVYAQGTGTYLHNVITDDEGVCLADPLRPLITSRAEPGTRFRNPYLSFMLADAPGGVPVVGARNTTVQFRQGTGALTANLVRSELPDVLPATVRYQADRGELYIVDSASQGLQRYFLLPFARESSR